MHYTPKKLWLVKSDVDAICRPLNQFNISYFAHMRIYPDGRAAGLSNNPNFSKQYIINCLYNVDIHTAEKNTFNDFIMWDSIESIGKTKILIETAAEFGIRHCFTIVEQNKTVLNYYHFATHLNSPIINQTYLANFDLLKLFILHFEEKIKHSKELLSLYDFTYTLDSNTKGFTLKSNTENCNNQHKRAEFIKNLSIRTNDSFLNSICSKSLANQLESFNLTKREMECLIYTMKGCKAKQVAFELGISQRTVEEYINNIKIKMKVFSKADLVKKTFNLI